MNSSAGPNPACLGDLSHLLDAQPLGEGDADGGNGLPDGEGVDDGDGGSTGLEGVDAGSEAILQAEEPGKDLELGGGADDAERLKLVGDLGGGAALGEDVALRGTGLARLGGGDDVGPESGPGRPGEEGATDDDGGDDDHQSPAP